MVVNKIYLIHYLVARQCTLRNNKAQIAISRSWRRVALVGRTGRDWTNQS